LREKTHSMSGLIDATMESVHEIMTRLRPEVLDRLGLAAAIGWQAGEFQRRSGIRCNVSLPAEDLLLDRDRSTAVFRIFQELLTNVARPRRRHPDRCGGAVRLRRAGAHRRG